MRTRWDVFLVVWVLACLVSFVRAADEPKVPCDVYLIYDTSPITDSIAKEMRAVAAATVQALAPGDRLRVIAAHSSRARLLLLETIGPDEGRRKEILRIFNEIEAAVFASANLGKALEVPLAALQDRVNPPSGAVLVILVSDGELSSKRAAATLAATARLQDMGARVVITGTEGTSSALLVAAAEGRLHWHCLSKSDPAQWIADARKAKAALAAPPEQPPHGKEPETKPSSAPAHAVPAPPAAPPELRPHAMRVPPVPAPFVEEPGEAMLKPSSPTPQTRGSSPLELRLAGILTFEDNARAGQNQAKAASAPPRVVPTPPSTTKPVTPKLPTASPQARELLPPPPMPKSSTVSAPETLDRSPLQLPASGPPAQVQPATGIGATAPSIEPPASSGRWPWRWVAFSGLLMFAALVALGGIRARRRRTLAPGADPRKDKDPRTFQLIVAANGREHVLGPPELIGSVRVGSEATNAVILNAEGVAAHHLAISRRGLRWRIRNLSSTPVEVNGLELPGRKKLLVPLPAVLKLSDKAHVRVFIRSTTNSGNRESSAPANQEHQQ